MSGIIRIEHDRDRPYVVVSKTLSEDTRLSFALRGVLVFLLGKPDGWTTYMAQVEKSGKEGREAIAAIFIEGRKFGYIKTTARREKGKFVYEHTIHERPLDQPVPMIIEKDGQPHTANRKRQTVDGQPHAVSRVLVSNDSACNEEHVKREEAATPPALSAPPLQTVETAGPPAVKSEPPLDSPESVQTFPPVSNIDDQFPEKVAGSGAAVGGPGEVEKYLRRKLSYAFIDNLLEETPPLGVDRRRDWFSLPLDRVKSIEKEAQVSAAAKKLKVPTRFKELLDEASQRLGLPARPGEFGITLIMPPADPDADPLAALLAGASLNGTRGRR